MKYVILIVLLIVLQACSVAHTRSIPEQTISMPRAQLAEMGDTCTSLALTLLSCPNYLATIPCCGICFALPLYICSFPLSFALFCCGFLLPLLEFLCFELPMVIVKVLIQISKILLLAVELCIEAPIICLEDLTVLLRDLPGICGAVC